MCAARLRRSAAFVDDQARSVARPISVGRTAEVRKSAAIRRGNSLFAPASTRRRARRRSRDRSRAASSDRTPGELAERARRVKCGGVVQRGARRTARGGGDRARRRERPSGYSASRPGSPRRTKNVSTPRQDQIVRSRKDCRALPCARRACSGTTAGCARAGNAQFLADAARFVRLVNSTSIRPRVRSPSCDTTRARTRTSRATVIDGASFGARDHPR